MRQTASAAIYPIRSALGCLKMTPNDLHVLGLAVLAAVAKELHKGVT